MASAAARLDHRITFLLAARGFGEAATATLALNREFWTDAETWKLVADARGERGGRTRLQYRASRGDDAGVRALLGYGAAVDLEDDEGETALSRACRGGHHSTALALLAAGTNADPSGVSPLCAACEGGHEAIARELLRRGVAIEIDGERSALAAASKGGLFDLVRELVERGADLEGVVCGGDPIYTPQTALYNAADAGRVDILRYLADRGAAIEAPEFCRESPLFAACIGGHVDVVGELLARDAILSVTGFWSIEAAAAQEGMPLDPEVVSLLEAARRVPG